MSDINIGALSEVINDKMDRDLNNRSDDSGLRKLVESYVNGTEWYKVFDEIQSDGTVKQWCEQGGLAQITSGNITLLKPMLDTNGTIIVTPNNTVGPSNTAGNPCGGFVSNAQIFVSSSQGSLKPFWRVEGYIS